MLENLKSRRKNMEHTLAKEAVENLRYKTSNHEKFKQYFQFLGINPENLDLDQVAEDIKNVSGN